MHDPIIFPARLDSTQFLLPPVAHWSRHWSSERANSTSLDTNSSELHQTPPNSTENPFSGPSWFLPTQARWLTDQHHLRIWEKSRQVGATKTDALDSVMKVSPKRAKYDVWVTSRDELQARLYLDDCKEWAELYHIAASDLGLLVLDKKSTASAYVLQFANGHRIYCLSSNPNALAGKRGHVKIDEFALHPDQRELYKIAKPVTQWGGTLSIISTHRGPNTVFNQIIRDILHNGNPMGWHHFKYTLQDAVAEGLLDRINEKSGRNETPEQFLKRTEAECIDKDQWLQEYCCVPSDDTTSFLTLDLISSCEDPNLKLITLDQLHTWLHSPDTPADAELYLGMDFARHTGLSVIDVGIKDGETIKDFMRIEMRDETFTAQEAILYRLLRMPQLKRACIDYNGNGMQLSENAHRRFGWRVEPVHTNSAAVQQKIAFGLRSNFESGSVRIVVDPKLRQDLHAVRKAVTNAGNVHIEGRTDDGHCDRFWAKAFRQEAARPHEERPWALLC